MCVSARYVCILSDTSNTFTKRNEKLACIERIDNISIELVLGDCDRHVIWLLSYI